MQAGSCELKPLAHPKRQIPWLLIRDMLNIKLIQRFRNAPIAFFWRNTIKTGMQIKVGPHRKFLIKRKGLRHVSDVQARFDITCLDRPSKQLCPPLAGGQQPRQHFHGRRLATTIGAQKTEYLTPPNAEIYMVNSDEITKAARQPFCLNNRWTIRERACLRVHRLRLRPLLWVSQPKECLFQRRCARCCEYFACLSVNENTPRVHCHNPTETLRLLHIGGRYYDSHTTPFGLEPVDQRPELATRKRVDASGRLVQDEKIGIMN